MIHVCMLCMVNRPPLTPLSPEHRALLETIVSPVINMADFQAFDCQWLMCETCKQSIQTVYNFQQTALVGVKNLLLYLKTRQNETVIEETKPMDFVKVEPPPEVSTATSKDNFTTIEAPRNVKLLTEELIVKFEPEPPDSKHELEDEADTVSASHGPERDTVSSASDTVSSASHESGPVPAPTQPNTTNPPLYTQPYSQDSQQVTVTQQVRVRNMHQMLAPNTQQIPVPYIQPVRVPDFYQGPVPYTQPVQIPNIHQDRVPYIQPIRVPDIHHFPMPYIQPVQLPNIDHQFHAPLPNTQQVMPVIAESEWNFEVFTHQPQPENTSNYNYVNGVLTCPLCARVLMNKSAYVSHMKGHANRERQGPNPVRKKYVRKKERVTCPHCDKSLRSNDSLKIHMTRSHGEISPCECDVCGKQCRNEVALKLHKYTHTYKEIKASRESIDTMRPELFCTECCMQLSSPSAYRIHLMTRKHTPKEHYKFECSTCSARFLDERRLQRHVEIVHLRKGAYKCDKCDKNYGTEKALRKHNIDAHENTPKAKPTLICHLCGKTFTIRKSLREHLLKHEGLRPHQCPLCPATFTYEAALYTHNRLKHLNIKRKSKKKKVEKEGGESVESCDSDGGKIKRKRKKTVEKEGGESAESCDSDGGKIKRKRKKTMEEEGEESAESCDSDGGKIKRKRKKTMEKEGVESAESCDSDEGKIKLNKVGNEGEENSAESYDGDEVEELLKIM